MQTIKPEAEKAFKLWNEHVPTTLTPYWPEPQNERRSAMVILPGGGYSQHAAHEGEGFARWFVARGTVCFVLHYRLGPQGYKHPSMWEDAARAVRYVRAHAAEWNIDPEKIGIIGSSAGGHLAATTLTRFDAGNPQAKDPLEKVSSRPSLGILCYPVISMVEKVNVGSRNNLIGENPSEELKRDLSAELQVTPQTPPCFIWHTWEDPAVPVENALMFAAALRHHNVRFDLHIYQNGRHGLGLGNGHPWSSQCEYWLREQKFF